MTGAQPLIVALADDLVAGDPQLATILGRTEGLGELPSYSPAAVAARVARARRAVDELTPFVTAASAAPAPDAGAADAAVAVQIVRRFLRLFELRRVHEARPSHYLEALVECLMTLLLHEIAPPDERLDALRRRLEAVPGYLEEALANLKPGLPRVMVENGLAFAAGLHDLLGPTVLGFARSAGAEGLLDDASVSACEALDTFAAGLERLLPVSVDRCAAGRAVLEDVRVHEHMLDETPEQLAAYGRRVLAETQGEMAALAAEMGFSGIEVAVDAARDDHPTAERLVAGYREAVEAARAFIVSRDLVTLPSGERLAVIPTPPYLRSVLPFAAYIPPGPFAAEQLGYYLVTPPRTGLGPAELEEALRVHPVASLAGTGVHEAYPGHHVQITRANRAPSLARRLTLAYGSCPLLCEGWAFYCEEMMDRQGFYSTPVLKLMRLADQAWRACRVVIDAELHTGRLPFAEAVRYLAREAYMDPAQAELEVRWYVESPGEPMSYLLGKREVTALAGAFGRRRSASLKMFHDALLDWGSASPRLIAWGLGLAGAPPACGGGASPPAGS